MPMHVAIPTVLGVSTSDDTPQNNLINCGPDILTQWSNPPADQTSGRLQLAPGSLDRAVQLSQKGPSKAGRRQFPFLRSGLSAANPNRFADATGS